MFLVYWRWTSNGHAQMPHRWAHNLTDPESSEWLPKLEIFDAQDSVTESIPPLKSRRIFDISNELRKLERILSKFVKIARPFSGCIDLPICSFGRLSSIDRFGQVSAASAIWVVTEII
jgi:hypothetical protein